MKITSHTRLAVAGLALFAIVGGAGAANKPADGYSHCIWIKASGYTNDTTIAEFPALIRLNKHIIQYSDVLQPGGGDIIFHDENGTRLDHEIETWETSGESLIWVRLSLTKDMRIRMSYGGGSNTLNNAENVWYRYSGVWHLSEPDDDQDEQPTVTINSQTIPIVCTNKNSRSGFYNNGVNYGTIYESNGAIGAARRISAGDYTVKDYHRIDVGNRNTGVESRSYSLWLKYPSAQKPGGDRIVCQQAQIAALHGWTIQTGINDTTKVVVSGDRDSSKAYARDFAITDSALYTDNKWHHLVVVFNNKDRLVYVDDKICLTNSQNNAVQLNTNKRLCWGGYYDTSDSAADLNGVVTFKGWMDELRITDGGSLYTDANAAIRVKAEYDNVMTEGFFEYERERQPLIICIR